MTASVWQVMIRESGLPSTDRHLLRVIGEFAGAVDGWPTTRQIAQSMNVGVVTVLAHTVVLEDQGWLVREGWPPRYKPAIRADQMRVMMAEAG